MKKGFVFAGIAASFAFVSGIVALLVAKSRKGAGENV